MNREKRIVVLACMVSVVVLTVIILLFVRDRNLTNGSSCADELGLRPRIDPRNFETNYGGYSIEIEGDITGKGKVAAKLEPVALAKLTESLQRTMEFRKLIVANYNACAISRADYNSLVSQFQTLDSIAHQIDELIQKPTLTGDQDTILVRLVDRYIKVSEGAREYR